MENLTAITSNEKPMREVNYPRSWFLYKDKHIIEIHVRHDHHQRPFVFDKGAA